jgi:hypothetical protein
VAVATVVEQGTQVAGEDLSASGDVARQHV